MIKKVVLSFYILIGFLLPNLGAQCTPPEAEICDDASTLCSFDDLNGYQCQNNSSQASGCIPLCSQGGAPHNTGWWAFVCDGGNVTLAIEILSCITGQGMQFGIWGDCGCGEEIACQAIPCVQTGTFTLNANLIACKTYYLWVDGCSGDVCDFRIHTSGGGRPRLNPLGRINNDADRRIDVCQGQCNYRFSVPAQPGGCEPTFVWELDGNEVGTNSNEVILDFPDEGTFSLCVTAYIGNPESGSICEQEGPECISIRVVRMADRTGPKRYLCFEETPFQWHSQSVTSSGIYTEEFMEGINCCLFDSIREFIVLDKPEPAEIYHIGCDPTDVYKGPTGIIYNSCREKEEQYLPKSTNPHKCDSAIIVSVIILDFKADWKLACKGGKVELDPNFEDQTVYCGELPDYILFYRWYKKKDPLKLTISTATFISVDPIAEDYVCELRVQAVFGTAKKDCTYTFAETFDESKSKPSALPVGGDLQVCNTNTAWYFVNGLSNQNVLSYQWKITGGKIISKPDSSNVEVKWNNGVTQGRICVALLTDCGLSPDSCLNVIVTTAPKPNAGPDKNICALSNLLEGKKDKGTGGWTQLSGPGATNFQNPSDPVTQVDVNQYGAYVYRYNESFNGCDGSDTVTFLFNANPDSSKIVFICNGSNTQFRLRFEIVGGTAPFKIISGTGTIDTTTNVYLSSFLDNLTMNTIIIEDVYGCRLEFPFTHECKCTNSVGKIVDKTAVQKCESELVTFQYDGNHILDPNDTLLYLVVRDPLDIENSIVEYLSQAQVQYNPNLYVFGTDYYIVIIVGKKNGKGSVDFLIGCVQEEKSKPFRFYQNPTPDAGIDDKICGTFYDLKGQGSIQGTNINWIKSSGGSASFNDPNDPATQVNTNGNYGTYTFDLTEDNNGCIGIDQVTIAFNESPTLTGIQKICLIPFPPYPYFVIADIELGNGPFTVIQGGGKIDNVAGKYVYTSDTLPSLDTFRILIQDINGCLTELVVDIHNCDCGPIDACFLDTNIIEVCIDQSITMKEQCKANFDGTIENEMYILHRGFYKTSPIDTFLSINDPIVFDPLTMTVGTIYYITRVVGKRHPITIIDPLDPCKRISNDLQIRWNPYPVPEAGAQDEICFFNYQLNGITNTGNPTWRFLSGAGTSTITNPNNDVTNVTVSQYGKYLYELEENFKGCISRDTVEITHHGSPNFVTPSLTVECDNIAENYRITVQVENGDIPSWFVNSRLVPSGSLTGSFINSTTWQTDWIPTGVGYELTVNDQYDCLPAVLPGLDTCQCITAIGNLNPQQIILCKDKDATVAYAGGTQDANDIIRYVLYDGNPNNPLNGTIIVFNDNGTFRFDPATMVLGRTYYIAAFVGNIDPITGNVLFSDRCMLATPGIPVTWYEYPVAVINGNQRLTCTVTSLNLSGTNSTSGSGQTVNYDWSTTNGRITTGTTGGTVSIDRPGTYKLFVTDPVSGCTHETTYVITEDVTKPTVAIAVPEEITCAKPRVNLDGNGSSKGSIYTVNWTGSGPITNAQSYTAEVDQAGTYTIQVTNTDNGCVDTRTVTVVEDKVKPIPAIDQIGQLTCTVKEVQLDGSRSRGQSGVIGTYSWSTTNGTIVAGQGTGRLRVSKAGSYSLRVVDQKNGCEEVTNIEVLEIGNPLLGFELLTQNPLCFGERNGGLDISNVFSNAPTDKVEFSFNNGAYTKNTTFSNLSQGSYSLKMRDENGCEKDTNFTLIEPSKLGIQVIRSIVVDQGTTVRLDSLLKLLSGGTAPYADTTWWNINDNVDWEPRLTYQADTTRDFIITGIDASGCKIEERVRVIVRIIKDVWWPSTFSPNGDGKNDVWNVKGKRIVNVRNLQIYDRWGEMVYSAENIQDGNNDPVVGWNGIFRGHNSLPGVYVFYAEVIFQGATGYEQYKGDFTLLR